MEKLYAVTLLLVLTTFSSAQLQADVERPCPGDRVEFTCTISSDRHLWEVPNLNITQGLLRSSMSISDPPFEFAVFGRTLDSIASSIAVVIVTTLLIEDLNGTLILCRDGNGTEPEQNTTIILRAPPSATPGTPSVSFSIPGQQFTITWDEPTLNMGELVDAYFVNISGPNDLCGNGNTLQRVTERSYTCTMQTTPQVGDTYTIRVAAASCGGSLTGPESEPLHLQVPDAPLFTLQPDCPGLEFVDVFWLNTGMIMPPITEICANCTGDNCTYECRPVSANFRISNIVPGENYTITLSLRNGFGQSGESVPQLYVNNDEQCRPTTSSTTSTPQTQPPSPTLTPSTSPPLPPPDASSNAGAIAGGVIGGLVGVIIIILIIVVIAYLIWRKENLPKPKRGGDIKLKNGRSPETMYQDPNTIVHETAPSGEVYAVVDKSQELRYAEIGFTKSGEVPEQESGVVYSHVQIV